MIYASQADLIQRLRDVLPIQAWCDSWALTNWILVDAISDANVWIEAALTRDEPTIDLQYEVTSSTYIANKALIRDIRNANIINVKEWKVFANKIGTRLQRIQSESDNVSSADIDNCRLVMPQEVRGFEDSFIHGLFPWIQFLTQKRLKAYYDDIEGIGVQAMISIEQGELVPELSGRLYYVGDIANAPYPEGMRWSFYGNSYMSGPVSIINCSCPNHRNVNMRPVSSRGRGKIEMEVISEWSINDGDKVFAAYNADMTAMLRTRGIQCLVCIKKK